MPARRAALIKRLGGKCVDCGATERLEFNHIHPRTWVANAVSRWKRIRMYELEADAGGIELRCRSCNAKKVHKPKEPEP